MKQMDFDVVVDKADHDEGKLFILFYEVSIYVTCLSLLCILLEEIVMDIV